MKSSYIKLTYIITGAFVTLGLVIVIAGGVGLHYIDRIRVYQLHYEHAWEEYQRMVYAEDALKKISRDVSAWQAGILPIRQLNFKSNEINQILSFWIRDENAEGNAEDLISHEEQEERLLTPTHQAFSNLVKAISALPPKPTVQAAESLIHSFNKVQEVTQSLRQFYFESIKDSLKKVRIARHQVERGSAYFIAIVSLLLLGISTLSIKILQRQTTQLLEAQVELERAKRLSDIGVLAATVAHELRNPLARVGIATHNVRSKAKNPDIEKHLVNIDRSVAESEQIIDNLLYYSRLKAPHYERVNIFDILEECAEGLNKKGKKEIMLIKKTESINGLLIEADSLQIKEVFDNILNNAYDAVPSEKGQITLIAENEDKFIKVTIEDNGAGISKDILEKIFEPFFTTKSKGTGLGLAVCRQIMDMHGGKIEVESEVNKGTAFTIVLPKQANV